MAGFGSVLIYTFGLFVKPLGSEFGWSRQTVSIGFACASMTLGFCSPLLGHWIDRYGARRVILCCIAIFGTAYASLATLQGSLAQLFLTFVLIGAVGNGTAQMGYARVISTWFEKRRGFALAIMMAGSGCGAIVIPMLCQYLITNAGWRTAYFVFGVSALAIGLPLVGFVIRENPAASHSLHRTDTGTVRKALRSRGFWFLIVMLAMVATSTTGTVTHMAAMLTDAGISTSSAAFAVAVLGVASLMGRLVTGWFLDRYFGGWVGFFLLSMTAAGLMVLINARSEAAAVAAAVLIGFSMGGEMDITPYMLARYFGLGNLSAIYGFTWTAYAASAAAGTVIMGRAFDQTGTYGPLLWKLSAMTFVGGALLAFMPKYPDARATDDLPPAAIEAEAMPT